MLSLNILIQKFVRNGQTPKHQNLNKLFLHKVNENTQRKPGVKCLIHLRIKRPVFFERKIQNFVTS